MKPKFWAKPKLCYIDTDSFTVFIKTEDIYVDIAKDTETNFETSNYQLEGSLPIEKKLLDYQKMN